MSSHICPAPFCLRPYVGFRRGGVEDTRLEAKAKDTKKSAAKESLSEDKPLKAKERNARGQNQGPRTQAQVFKKKKEWKESFSKTFFRRSPKEEKQKRSSQIFREVSGVSYII